MIQTVHMKCAKFLVILCTMTCVRCSWPDLMENDVSEDTDDDKKLKQALILVDLLKNEYMRALTENRALRKMESMHTTLTEEESTCASSDKPTTSPVRKSPTTNNSTLATSVPSRATTASPKTVNPKPKKRLKAQTPLSPSKKSEQSALTTLKSGRRRRLGGMTPHSVQKFSGKQRFQLHRFNRRRMSDDNDYGPNSPGPSYHATRKPGGTKKPVSFRRQYAGGKKLIARSKVAKARKSAPTTKDLPILIDISEELDDEPNTSQTAKGTADVADIATERTTETEPVQAQVASEILSEMKTVNDQLSKKYLALIKPTLKVHLSGSTRLPIPLPENHAFCYTNPKNPLCRTSV